MPNTLGPYDPIDYAQTALSWLRKTLGFGSRVYRGYDRAPAEKGSVITLRRPQAYTATAMPATPTDLLPESVNVTLSEWWGVTIQLTDKELAYTKERIVDEQIAPMAYAVANKIDQLLAALYKDIPWSVAVTAPLAVTDITAARKVLSTNGVPLSDGRISLALSPTLMKEALDQTAFSQWQGAGPTGEGTQQSGILGGKFGMSPFENQNQQAHTSGVSADSTGALVGAHAKGATTVTFNGVTIGGTFKAGDTFIIAGNTQRYTLTADATADGAGLVAPVGITPPLVQAYSGSDVITFQLDGAGKEVSLAFHRDAFALAMAVLPDQIPGIDVFTATDAQSQLSVRARRWAEGSTAKQFIGLDALFGVKTLNSNMAVRLFDQ
jgi:P22 coat protein - gene protein 5